MEKVKALKVYVLQNRCTNNQLFLCLGSIVDESGRCCWGSKNIRWLIRGAHNPLPVRNGTWFQGFSHVTMFEWFSKNGFILKSTVDIAQFTNAYASSQKKNEIPVEDRVVVEQSIRTLCNDCHCLTAYRLYAAFFHCSFDDAVCAVREMCKA